MNWSVGQSAGEFIKRMQISFLNIYYFSGYNSGNLVSWMKQEPQWHNLIRNVNICTDDNPVDVLLPWCLGMVEAKQLCNKYRGELTIITSSKLQNKLFSMQELSGTVDGCNRDWIWTGFSDEQLEGHFIDANNGIPSDSLIDTVPFHPSQPNGERAENCVAAGKLLQYDTSWYDTYCHGTRPFSCRMEKNPRVQIRGVE